MRQQRKNIERLNGAGEQIAARIDSIYAMHFHVDIQLRRLRCIEMEYINFKYLKIQFPYKLMLLGRTNRRCVTVFLS